MTVAVRVADSASGPIAGADVAIVRGIAEPVARATTSPQGRATLDVSRSEGTLQLTVRKIGFQAAYRFFSVSAADTVTVDVRLARTVVTLAPVTVSAAEDLKRKSYHLGAEDIENSGRPIIDGSDIFKLRPDMMNSRGGAMACAVPWTPRTGWIESVWVNGIRVTLADVDSVYVYGRKAGLGIPAPLPPRPNPRITRLPAPPRAPRSPFTAFSHIDTVLSILRNIHPEHIQEITYHDCFDDSIGKNNSDMSMFVVLKPGIGYKNGVGSYVIDDHPAAGRALSVDSLPRFRFRLLGVYDLDTGDPVPDVDVIDSASGVRAKTTATGTVSLFFVPEGSGALRLHRDGFRDTTLAVTISPVDTVPLTILIRRQRDLVRGHGDNTLCDSNDGDDRLRFYGDITLFLATTESDAAPLNTVRRIASASRVPAGTACATARYVVDPKIGSQA
ncbi:MAG: hypothetical protein JWM41_2813 [Gemmatimonadetes bacterium]|nr:hypothetical protein [Gemmatimonadota bacterium]